MQERDDTLPTQEELIDRILLPFQWLLHAQSSGGIVLIVCTIVALVWANSPWSGGYDRFWHTELTLKFGQFRLTETLVMFINDALMAAFFFLVGLEIKRELLVGELALSRQAALPIAAAVGGMIAPALIYAAFNRSDGNLLQGWGVPMATDIAFATLKLSIDTETGFHHGVSCGWK